MTDRELLELAAKAGGYVIDSDGDRLDDRENGGAPKKWRPLDDDGDALRLVVKLGFCVTSFINTASPDTMVGYRKGKGDGANVAEAHGSDPYAATRRAIVRAAAEIGKEAT